MNIYEGVVEFYNQHGEGVVLNNKKPYYVYGAIIDEKIKYQILKEFKTYGIAQLIEIIEKSKNRIDHNIKDAHLIGGYDLIHMNEGEQKNFKVNRVKNDFKKIAQYELDNIEWFAGKNKFKYRNKITLHDGFFYQKNSKTKIAINDFLLSSIKWDPNLRGDIIYRQLDTLIYGTKNEKKYTSDTLFGFKFRVGLNSFYQINKEVTKYAYQFIRENIIKEANTLDLYCGIGTISIILSPFSKKVIGVEINKESYEDAIYNKKINKIDNVDFINKSVDQFVCINDTHFENIILDPSRKGVGKQTIQKIINDFSPERIIYMSCNPATQASDFSYLKDFYQLDKIVVLDMFPQTYHIETIIVLSKK
ncbi:class I SAM-dependent RNA methyltransferase [Mesomycoplasma moatsii]|uniref:class I SAM-dependent RNA methyltransferase n=1 Tax=Mesomycoplasma moatsii TaxID=171287 RepID=UPI0003B7498F